MRGWKEYTCASAIWAAMERMERSGFRAEVNRYVTREDTLWTAAATDGRSTWVMTAGDPLSAMGDLMDRLGLEDFGDRCLSPPV